MLPCRHACLALLTLLALTACQSLGLAPAQSFNDRLGYAIASHTAVLQTATAALEAGEISAVEAESLAAIADNARRLIDSARAVYAAGDITQAEERLVAVIALLEQLKAYLRGDPP